MNLDQMIFSLKEWLQFQVADDIIDCPDQRAEFQPYVNRCIKFVPKPAVPYVVLFMLEEERNSKLYKIKKFLKLVK